MDGEDGAAVGVMMDAAALTVDEGSDVFIEESFGIDAGSSGGGSFFDDEFGVEFLVDFKLATEGARVDTVERVKVMMCVTKVLAMDDAKVATGAGEFNHKDIISYPGGSLITFCGLVIHD